MTFSNNIITGCNEGVRMIYSSGNVVSGNIVQNCYYNTGVGIDYGSNNIVYRNTIIHNHYGISGGIDCHGNTFSENTIINNDIGFGTTSYDNKFFHNSFVNNGVHVIASGINQFDDSYPSGGNYWSNYGGSDAHSGTYQNETGSDGIGDALYVIDASNRDNYPLMNPYPSGPVKLTVSSDHDSPNPSSGDHYYVNGSSVTCSVTSPVTEGMTVWSCGGCVGNGSVPSSYPSSYTPVTFTITQDSSITWKWSAWNLVYIRPDGSIDPPTAPIQREGNVYCLNDFITFGWAIYIERNNTVFNGGGCYLIGPSWGSAIILQNVFNVTVMNTNFADGRCGIYLENCSNCDITHNFCTKRSSAMDVFIYLFNSSSNTIEYNNVDPYSSLIGIRLSQSSDNIVRFNLEQANRFGIWLESGTYNVIDSNTLYGNHLGAMSEGLFILSDFNNVSHNIIGPSYCGINLWGACNNVYQNTFTGCDFAIREMGGEHNAFAENNLTGNNWGVYFHYPSCDTFVHNTFNNTVQTYADSDPGNNTWDDGYPSGGNYWSDYSGTDANHDGIGDTPYVIDADNVDHYPLMKTFGAAYHDVVVTSASPSKTIVRQGNVVQANVTVENHGDFAEAFNVTLYANATKIGSQEVELASGNSMSIALLWNTSSFARGKYALSAVADAVQGETNTTDNVFTDGVVLITAKWDVNADGKIDVVDVAMVSAVFGSYPGHPKWNTAADINNDGKIDIIDIAMVARHFGESYL